LIRAISQMNAYSYEMQDNLLTLAEVLQAHSLSIKVIVWGWPEDAGFLFNPELVNKLLDWGIDSFITDNLDDISDIFLQRGIAIPKTLYS